MKLGIHIIACLILATVNYSCSIGVEPEVEVICDELEKYCQSPAVQINEGEGSTLIELKNPRRILELNLQEEMQANGVAWRYFIKRDLKKREGLRFIKVNIIDNKENRTHATLVSDILLAKDKIDTAEWIISLIKEKKYSNVYNLFDYSVLPSNLNELDSARTNFENWGKDIDAQFGEITSFELAGFTFFDKDGKSYLQLAYLLFCQNNNLELSLIFNIRSVDFKLYGFKYEW